MRHIFKFSRYYGNRQSLPAAQQSRLAMAFESKETARQRTEMAKNAKKRNPVGNLDTKVFDKEKLKKEVESYTDDVALNWSELARRHNVQNTNGEPAKNGGQIIKEWLNSEGVHVAKFTRKHDGTMNTSDGKSLGDKEEKLQ